MRKINWFFYVFIFLTFLVFVFVDGEDTSKFIWDFFSEKEMNFDNVEISIKKGFFFSPNSTNENIMIGKMSKDDNTPFPTGNYIGLSIRDEQGVTDKIKQLCLKDGFECKFPKLSQNSDLDCVQFESNVGSFKEDELYVYCDIKMDGKSWVISYQGSTEAYPVFGRQLASLLDQLDSRKR